MSCSICGVAKQPEVYNMTQPVILEGTEYTAIYYVNEGTNRATVCQKCFIQVLTQALGRFKQFDKSLEVKEERAMEV